MKRGRQGEGGGRPLFGGKNEESILQLLRQAWAIGCPDCDAAALAGISPTVLSQYLTRTPKVLEEKEALLRKPFLSARNTIVKAIAGGNVETARWYLERRQKNEFGAQLRIDGSLTVKSLITNDGVPE